MHRAPVLAFVFSQDSCVVNNFGVTCYSLVAVVFFGSLAAQGPKIVWKKCPTRSMRHNGSMHHGAPLGGIAKSMGIYYYVVQDIDRGPPGRWCRRIQEHPPPMLENIDDRPPRRCCRRIQENPPAMLENINGGAPRRCCQRIREWPPSTLENVDSETPGRC
jgi:hypothetical protein